MLFGTFLLSIRQVLPMSLLDSLLDREFIEECLERKRGSRFSSQKGIAALESYCAGGTIEYDIESIVQGGNPFSPPKRVFAMEGGKQREFYAFDERANCLFWLVAQAFRPYERPYVHHCCSSALGPSIKRVFKDLRQLDAERQNWAVVADIRHYSNSMSPKTVQGILDLLVPSDGRAQAFMLSALQPASHLERNVEVSSPVFIGTGTALNSVLSNSALAQADAILAEKALLSTRFVDDSFAIYECEQDARAALDGFREAVGRCGFTLNEPKSYLVPPGQAFDCIGLRVSQEGIDLEDGLYARGRGILRQSTRMLLSKVRRGALSPDAAMAMLAQSVNQVLDDPEEIAWLLPLLGIITTDTGLRSLDRYLQDCMRTVGSGKTGPARYRISYECLKAHGYRSIVNWFHRNRF